MELYDMINLQIRPHPLMPDDIVALREVRRHSTRKNYRFMFVHLEDGSLDGETVHHPTEVIASPKICQRILNLKEKSLL